MAAVLMAVPNQGSVDRFIAFVEDKIQIAILPLPVQIFYEMVDRFPSWRKPVTISTYPHKVFFIQVYYWNEWTSDPAFVLVPADQTYIRTKNHSYTLFLKKGNYRILYRDMEYKILGTEQLKVR